jgi:hypothetical protein
MNNVKDLVFAIAPSSDPKWRLLLMRYMCRLDHGTDLDLTF